MVDWYPFTVGGSQKEEGEGEEVGNARMGCVWREGTGGKEEFSYRNMHDDSVYNA